MNEVATNQKTDRVLFVWLVIAGLTGSLIGVPWAMAVIRNPFALGAGDPQAIWLSVAVEALILLPLASAVGVWLGRKVGLGPRLMRELVSKSPEVGKQARSVILPTILVGLILGVLGIFIQNAVPKSALMPGLDNPNSFEWFLRCISAGITEEIFFRLGLMTFFVWIIRLLIKKPSAHTPSLWIGNLLAALIFAVGHMPQLSFQTSGWSLFIPFVLVSGGTGLIMGWLYMRYGLLSAITAHFLVDLIVFVIPGLLGITA
jgi:membrane protease YdiL (CAAX protease family)